MGYVSEGKKVEQQFAQLFNRVAYANEQQDMYDHWDVELQTRVDVKGMRKIRRTDDAPTEDYQWIELKNVTGKPGWLFGQADLFAFETARLWVLVDKQRLQDFTKSVLIKQIKPEPTLYYLYQRKGRQDMLVLVKTLDLCGIASRLVHKGREGNTL